MKRLLSLSAPLALILFLAACGAIPGNEQVNAGITHATVKVCQKKDGGVFVCAAEIIDGKEKQNVSLVIKNPVGWQVEYSANGVRAFEGQKIRGAVEDAISDDLKAAAPGIVDSVMGAIVKAVVP